MDLQTRTESPQESTLLTGHALSGNSMDQSTRAPRFPYPLQNHVGFKWATHVVKKKKEGELNRLVRQLLFLES